MRHKVSELEGPLLDAAVAKAEGHPLSCDWNQGDYILIGTGAGDLERFEPSSDWSLAGPLIEREHIELMFGDEEDPGRWSAYIRPTSHAEYRAYLRQGGATALIAAMRAYIASRMGETVELP